MIKSIRSENVFNAVNAISSITSLCECFSDKPDDKSLPSGSFLFTQIVTDTNYIGSNKGTISKRARISFTIICKKTLGSNETPERILMTIVDTISNEIVNQGCDKLFSLDGIRLLGVQEDTISPIFFDDGRRYLVKDYIFTYISMIDG